MKVIATLSMFTEDSNYNPVIERANKIWKAGIHTIRINIRWTSEEYLYTMLEMIKLIKIKFPTIEIMLDFPYPKKKPRIRILSKHRPIYVKRNKYLRLYYDKEQFTNEEYDSIYIDALKDESILKDEKLYYDDGKGCFQIINKENGYYLVKAFSDFIVYQNKSLPLPMENKINEDELIRVNKFIRESCPQSLAFSFVEKRQDICRIMKNFDIPADSKLYVKIETEEGVNNLEEIMKENIRVILGRGDLGYNCNICQLKNIQDYVISKAKEKGVEVIIATDILSSLQYRIMPSRADLIDLFICKDSAVDGLILNAFIDDFETAKRYIDLM